MNKHTAELLEKHFDTAFAAPDGIKKLRELILTLAMQGKLVPQDPKEQPASELLQEIEAEKQRLVKEGHIKKPKPLLPVTEEEKPYALPQEWDWVRLGAISSYIQRGKGPSYVDFSTHRVISQKCVRWYGLDLDSARYIDPESLEKYESLRFLQGGDLLWNSTGTGTIGRACLVPYGLNNTELVADSHVTIVRTLSINNQFLWRWIQSPWVQADIETSASGTTNQIELNTSTVINHLIPLPPLAEQNRIVAKIDELMARCDELEKLRTAQQGARLTVHAAAIKQLLNIAKPDQHQRAQIFLAEHFSELYTVKENVAELRKAILQLAVMGKLVPQDPNDQPASELLQEIEAEKQRLVKRGKIKKPKPLLPVTEEEKSYALPKGWAWVRLGNLALSSDSGWSPQCLPEMRKDKEWGVLKVSAVSWGKFNPDENKALPVSQSPRLECEVKSGDFLISRANTDELVARSVIVDSTPPHLMMSDKIVRFTLSCHVNRLFVNTVNGAPYSRIYYMENASGTSSSMKNVSRKTISLLPIPLPPFEEQHRIVAKIDQLMALCDVLNHHIDATSCKQTELLNALIYAHSQGKAADGARQTSPSHALVIDLAARRAAIGCYTVSKLANAPYFGRTAAAKVLYLAQAHAGLELALKPWRQAAGPYDPWIREFENQGQGNGWFEVNDKALANGKTKKEYRCLPSLSEPAAKAEVLMSPNQKAEFDRLIYALAVNCQ